MNYYFKPSHCLEDDLKSPGLTEQGPEQTIRELYTEKLTNTTL